MINKQLYFRLELTENEHYIAQAAIEKLIETYQNSGWNISLVYYRKIKTGHIPMIREVKIEADNDRVIGQFRKWAIEERLFDNVVPNDEHAAVIKYNKQFYDLANKIKEGGKTLLVCDRILEAKIYFWQLADCFDDELGVKKSLDKLEIRDENNKWSLTATNSEEKIKGIRFDNIIYKDLPKEKWANILIPLISVKGGKGWVECLDNY